MGQNIYRPYNYKLGKFNNYIGQGRKMNHIISEITCSQIIKPKWHLRMEFGYRQEILNGTYSGFVFAGLRTTLFNDAVDY
jgi:hypothetical protein